jgi:hypothetical protein
VFTKGFGHDKRNPPLQNRSRHDIGHDMSCPYVINHTLFGDQSTQTSWQHVVRYHVERAACSFRMPLIHFSLQIENRKSEIENSQKKGATFLPRRHILHILSRCLILSLSRPIYPYTHAHLWRPLEPPSQPEIPFRS